MNIIKHMTVAKIPLSQEASKVMYFVCELGLFLVELEKWPLQNKVTLGLDYISTDELLDILHI